MDTKVSHSDREPCYVLIFAVQRVQGALGSKDTVAWLPSRLPSCSGLFLLLPLISQDWSLAPYLSNVLQIALAPYRYIS